jgi:hypothetical protein
MRFIQEFGYTVKVGQEEAHQRWLIENDARIKAAAPPGSKYMGTFAVVFHTEKRAGGYRMMFELDSYGAMDAAAAAGKEPKSEWAKMQRDSSAFIDLDLNAPWSNGLLKDVVDATIWDPKT